MVDISDKAVVKKAERQEKDLRKQELNDIRTVLSNASGRRFMWRMLSQCNAFASIHTSDANMMYYKSGKQDIGHYLIDEITEADENLFIKLMKDNKGVKDGN